MPRPTPFRHLYGAGPGHLLAIAIAIALTATAITIVATDPAWPVMLIWFLAAVLLHDFILFPLYTAIDRALTITTHRAHTIPVINHIRIPLLGAALTFLMFLPGIIQQSRPTLNAAAGLDTTIYFGRWLSLTGAMILISAIIYVIRLIAARRSNRTPETVHSPDGAYSSGVPEADPLPHP